MSVIQVIALWSIVGAFLFFMSGYFMRGLRLATAAPGMAPSPNLGNGDEASELRQQNNTLRRDLEESNAALANRNSTLEALRKELSQAKAAAAAVPPAPPPAPSPSKVEEKLRVELKVVKEELRAALEKGDGDTIVGSMPKDLADEPTVVREVSPEVQVLQGELKRLKADLQRAEAKVKESERVKAALTASEAKANAAVELEKQVEELQDELQAARDSAVSVKEHEELKAKQRDMLIKAQMMQQRVSELEHYADEVVSLRDKGAQLDDLSVEVKELRSQKRDLEAKLFAAGYQDPVEKTVAGPGPMAPPPVQASEVEVGTSLDEHLRSIIADGRAESLVISDDQGLLLSASGESANHEALAVVASMAHQLGERSTELLPLSRMRFLQLQDENGASLHAHALDIDGSNLTMAALRSAQAGGSLETVLGDLARIIQRQEVG